MAASALVFGTTRRPWSGFAPVHLALLVGAGLVAGCDSAAARPPRALERALDHDARLAARVRTAQVVVSPVERGVGDAVRAPAPRPAPASPPASAPAEVRATARPPRPRPAPAVTLVASVVPTPVARVSAVAVGPALPTATPATAGAPAPGAPATGAPADSAPADERPVIPVLARQPGVGGAGDSCIVAPGGTRTAGGGLGGALGGIAAGAVGRATGRSDDGRGRGGRGGRRPF